jgi:NADPH:quinone reductase-like Zn-dependent oxidoreductase
MNAINYTKYGPPDVCSIADVPTPTPAADELLIRVHETVLTRADVAGRTGRPLFARLVTGLVRPTLVPGTELTGEIEAVGDEVTSLAVGDRVIASTGSACGAHAEYACLPDSGVVAPLPDDVAYSDVAGLCDGGLTALQFLRDEGKLSPGESVLVNGASGAVGTYAVQLARHFGADVTGVCSADNAELVASLGADRVIDYTSEDFTENGERYDVVFDAVGTRSYSACRRSLAPAGRYLTTVPSVGIVLQMLRTKAFGSRKAIFAATGLSQRREDLVSLVDLVASGDLTAVVDRRYGLADVVAAHRYVETGHKRGNVVLVVGDDA